MTSAGDDKSVLYVGDARDSGAPFWDLPVRPRAIISSPPYWDLQDYGTQGQIGFGQSLSDYLGDVGKVLAKCYAVASDDATMWLVVGSIRRNGQLVRLPALIAHTAESANWIAREEITWSKGKSMPWTGHGQLRDVTEQILLFSKNRHHLFDVDSLRSPDPSSPWWVKYPERYSPLGRGPTNLWEIPIPTQGAWKQGPRHACPFPPDLTYRLISLITEPHDAVLDPFAGVGSVPAMAEAIGRVGYGIDVSPHYVSQLQAARSEAKAWLCDNGFGDESISNRLKAFRQLIIQLRLLKYGKLLASSLSKAGFEIGGVFVVRSRRKPTSPHKIVRAEFYVIVDGELPSGDDAEAIRTAAIRASSVRPLSKFGIEPTFGFRVAGELNDVKWFSNSRFWDRPSEERPTAAGLHLASRFAPRIKRF